MTALLRASFDLNELGLIGIIARAVVGRAPYGPITVAIFDGDTGRPNLVTDDEFVAQLDDGLRLPPYGVASAALAWTSATPADRLDADYESLIADGLIFVPETTDFATLLGCAYCSAAKARRS